MENRNRGGAQASLTKAQLRAQKALASARGRFGKSGTVEGARAGALGKKEALRTLGRFRDAHRIAELTGRTTSVARLRRHGEEEAELLEELELELEEEERREEIAKLGLAPPLPQSVLRPKPRKKS